MKTMKRKYASLPKTSKLKIYDPPGSFISVYEVKIRYLQLITV